MSNTLMLPPSPRCAGFGKGSLESGESRIVVGGSFGLTVGETPSNVEGRQSIKLTDSTYLIVWGVSDPTLERAKSDVMSQFRPWLCQRCGNRTCKLCGGILKVAQGADIVKDDGQVTHQMIVPADKTCSNPECERYSEGVNTKL